MYKIYPNKENEIYLFRNGKHIKIYGWNFRHIDYDGLEDERFGFGNSPEDCLESILNIESKNSNPTIFIKITKD